MRVRGEYYNIIPMAAPDRRTVTLPAEQSSFIDELVSTGRYASASEVVRAGLHALRERDAAVEHWLRTQAAEAYALAASGRAGA